MPNLDERYLEIRDDLIGRLNTVFPGLSKVHKVDPELVQGELPLGWVIRRGGLVPGDGSSRNHLAFRATFQMGVRFEKPVGGSVEDEQIRLVALLFDNLTNTAHHGTYGYQPEIVEMLGIEGAHDDKLFEVDLTFAVTFYADRTDAV